MTRVNRWNDPAVPTESPAAPNGSLWSEADEQRRKKRRLVTLAALGAVALLVIVAFLSSVGGTSTQRPTTQPADPEAFFEEAMTKLSRADDFIALDLRSEELVMRQMPDDGRQTTKDRLIYAVVLDDPDEEGQQYTIFQVPEIVGNPQFQTRGVKPGDTIYYFAMENEFNFTNDPYAKEQMRVYRDVNRPKAFKLQVRDVVDERTLRTIGGLTAEMAEPRLMDVFRHIYKSEMKGQFEAFIKPPIAEVNWQPSPDRQVLVKATADLNEWLHEAKADVEWQIDPLLRATIRNRAPAYQQITQLIFESVDEARLDQMSFDFDDARFIQEAVWLRDVSRAARSESGDLAKAKKLFDWTVRHIQLEPEQPDRNGAEPGLWHRPWQTLLYGRGTATERAWVFMLLARQQKLDVVMLAHPNPDAPEHLKFWLPALVGDAPQGGKPPLYLFDTTLGLPIEGPRGDVATLSDVLADESLLEGLHVDDQWRYTTSTSNLKPQVVAFIEASPRYFAKRMKLIEGKLIGRQRIKLSIHTAQLQKNLHDAGIEDVRLWYQPALVHRRQKNLPRASRRDAWATFQVYAWVPALWKARMLDFRELDATAARPAPTQRKAKVGLRDATLQATRDAIYFYLRCHKPDADLTIENIPAARSWLIQKRGWDQYAKMQAEYWLALVHFDNGGYSYAIDFLQNRWLKSYSGGPWQHGARYNLARTYEARGELKEAIAIYRDDVDSPQRHGNLLRARRLEATLPPPSKPLPENPDPKLLPPNPDPKLPQAAKAGG